MTKKLRKGDYTSTIVYVKHKDGSITKKGRCKIFLHTANKGVCVKDGIPVYKRRKTGRWMYYPQ